MAKRENKTKFNVLTIKILVFLNMCENYYNNFYFFHKMCGNNYNNIYFQTININPCKI